MKAKYVALIVAGVMILGGAVMGGAALAHSNFDFEKMTEDKNDMTVKTYEFGEKISNINVEGAEVKIVPTKDDKTVVETHETTKFTYSVETSGDNLSIKGDDDRKWYDYIGVFNTWPYVTVYLPEGEYNKLAVDNDVDGIKVQNGFTFGSVDLVSTTGSINYSSDVKGDLRIQSSTGSISAHEVVSGDVSIKASTGSIKTENIEAADIKLEASSGSIKATEVKGANMVVKATSGSLHLEDITAADLSLEDKSGSIHVERASLTNVYASSTSGSVHLNCVIAQNVINADATSGSVNLKGCDGKDIALKTTSGSVNAKLLTNKEIFATSNSGGVHLPTGDNGEINGKLSASATSGSVSISIEK